MISNLLFALGGLALAVFLVLTIHTPGELRAVRRGAIAVPLAACAVFLAVSLRALLTEGFGQLLIDHTRGAWSTQVWFDLLLAASVAWLGLLPRARRHGMRLGVWATAIALTGSLALLIMLARVAYLDAKNVHSAGNRA